MTGNVWTSGLRKGWALAAELCATGRDVGWGVAKDEELNEEGDEEGDGELAEKEALGEGEGGGGGGGRGGLRWCVVV